MGLLTTIKGWFGMKVMPGDLKPGDRMLDCEDCKKPFVFDDGEQRFFKEKGFTDPKRCPKCRKKLRFRVRRRPGGRSQSNSQQGDRNNNQNNNRGNNSRNRTRRHSAIDGDSPYADER